MVRVEDHSKLAFALALQSAFLRSVMKEKSGNGEEAEEEGTQFG